MTIEKLPDCVPVVHDSAHSELDMLQMREYRDHRLEVLSWLWQEGKDPDRAEGYSDIVVENTSYRLSKIYRWIWENEGYTTVLNHDHADAIVEKLRTRGTADENKSQYVKALQRYFGWRAHEKGAEEWEPEETFSPGQQTHHARDYFTLDERKLLRNATLNYASLPNYNDATPEERDRWKIYLAQRLEKPKNEVTPEDWEDAVSWKLPSIVAVSLDGGLRPVEVRRARVQWVDLQNAVLRIPKEEDSKATGGGENWTVSLREDTTQKLEWWLAERAARPKYDSHDELIALSLA
ncbi:site-specific integrase [Halapricum hydrolyticum]|uniref:Site-specific integrase n=1 Tax=Halapricum hydrolyticum TaxID=2979991 RepID=A0AAE3I8L4_9EURY|nr:site-specific integrase [Halapricum hydrolyticum]MCU4716704.1 site-specific integrase [Halapricum hydrolyticum]MCU4725691.1 site-specific integrase [Halapricum hydrolyticum]